VRPQKVTAGNDCKHRDVPRRVASDFVGLRQMPLIIIIIIMNVTAPCLHRWRPTMHYSVYSWKNRWALRNCDETAHTEMTGSDLSAKMAARKFDVVEQSIIGLLLKWDVTDQSYLCYWRSVNREQNGAKDRSLWHSAPEMQWVTLDVACPTRLAVIDWRGKMRTNLVPNRMRQNYYFAC